MSGDYAIVGRIVYVCTHSFILLLDYVFSLIVKPMVTTCSTPFIITDGEFHSAFFEIRYTRWLAIFDGLLAQISHFKVVYIV